MVGEGTAVRRGEQLTFLDGAPQATLPHRTVLLPATWRGGKLIESEFVICFTAAKGSIVRYRLLEDSFAVARAVSV